MSVTFVKSVLMQIEAKYEQEDGTIVVKYIDVNEDALEYFQSMNIYIGWLQDELMKKEVIPLRIEFSASSPILSN